jgi:uncharacterized membrane protein
MLVSWGVFRALGAAGLIEPGTWTNALRLAMAVMFFFTAASHFAPQTRPDLIRIVPSPLPRPDLLVTLTGLLEVLGAAGLLVPRYTSLAAWGLAALLVGLFPANVFADKHRLQIAGRRATPMVVRLPMQIFWIGALVWIALATW